MVDAREKAFIQSVDKEELVSLIRDLVRIDSVIRPETGTTEHNVAQYIVDWMKRELGIEPIVCEVAPNRENIILTIDSGRPGPCLMIEGHMDVVSEGDRTAWTHDPFGAEIVDGKIFGRGSCDMKAGDAIALLHGKNAEANRSALDWHAAPWHCVRRRGYDDRYQTLYQKMGMPMASMHASFLSQRKIIYAYV